MLNARRIASTIGRAISSITLIGSSGANGFTRWAKRVSPLRRIATIQIPKKTTSTSAAVVLRSAVGEPPNGKPSCLNGSRPNWLRIQMKMKIADEERDELLAARTQHADCEIRQIVDDRLERRLGLVDSVRAIDAPIQ